MALSNSNYYFLLVEPVKQTVTNLDLTWEIFTPLVCLLVVLVVTAVTLCKFK